MKPAELGIVILRNPNDATDTFSVIGKDHDIHLSKFRSGCAAFSLNVPWLVEEELSEGDAAFSYQRTIADLVQNVMDGFRRHLHHMFPADQQGGAFAYHAQGFLGQRCRVVQQDYVWWIGYATDSCQIIPSICLQVLDGVVTMLQFEQDMVDVIPLLTFARPAVNAVNTPLFGGIAGEYGWGLKRVLINTLRHNIDFQMRGTVPARFGAGLMAGFGTTAVTVHDGVALAAVSGQFQRPPCFPTKILLTTVPDHWQPIPDQAWLMQRLDCRGATDCPDDATLCMLLDRAHVVLYHRGAVPSLAWVAPTGMPMPMSECLTSNAPPVDQAFLFMARDSLLFINGMYSGTLPGDPHPKCAAAFNQVAVLCCVQSSVPYICHRRLVQTEQLHRLIGAAWTPLCCNVSPYLEYLWSTVLLHPTTSWTQCLLKAYDLDVKQRVAHAIEGWVPIYRVSEVQAARGCLQWQALQVSLPAAAVVVEDGPGTVVHWLESSGVILPMRLARTLLQQACWPLVRSVEDGPNQPDRFGTTALQLYHNLLSLATVQPPPSLLLAMTEPWSAEVFGMDALVWSPQVVLVHCGDGMKGNGDHGDYGDHGFDDKSGSRLASLVKMLCTALRPDQDTQLLQHYVWTCVRANAELSTAVLTML